MNLHVRDVINAGVRVSVAEAAGLVLAIAREVERRRASQPDLRVPSPDHILLSRDGQVSFTRVDPSGDPLDVRALALLLSSLLALDDARGTQRPVVPGALMVLLARAAGQINLPPPSWPAFVDALTRYSTADAATLRAVYWRVRSGRVEAQRRRRAEPVVAASDTPLPPVDRRLKGATRADLRRDLREMDQRLYEALHARPQAARRSGLIRGGSVTAVLGLLLAMLWVAAPPRRDPAPAPQPESAAVAAQAEAAPVSPPPPAPPPPVAAQRDAASRRASPLVLAASVGDDAFSPSFAARGRQLLFHAGRSRGALMRATLGERGDVVIETILRDGAANYHAALSPDGQWLAYDSDRDGTRAVYVARADASAPRKVSGDGYAAVPTWSPDGQKIAFIKDEPSRSRVWNVWIANLRDATLHRVSSHRVGQAWGASWFPAGDRVAYSVEDRLVIAPLDGGAAARFRSPIRGRLIRTPAVSPDGRFIVFQVSGDGVWVLDMQTQRMRRMIGDAAAEEFTWSPDGREVAYHTRRAGAWSVWRLPFDERGARRSPGL